MAPQGSRTGFAARIRRCRVDRRTAVLGAAGAVAGILCGLLGVAGGVVIVPVLTSRRIGMTRAEASGTTIAAVLPVSVVAAVTYAGLHNVDVRAASAIVPGAAAGVITGSLLAARVRAPVLRSLFNLVLLATAVRLLIALPQGSVHQIAAEATAVVTLCALGTFAGLASGMLGTGGGTFLVPALVLGFGLVQQAAQGTALLALIPIWVIGALTHHKTDTLRLQEAATVGSFGALTVPIGAEIASHVGAQPLRLIFAAFLITTVGWGLLQTQRRKPAAGPGPGSATSIQPGAGNARPARPAIAAAPGAGGPLPTTTGRPPAEPAERAVIGKIASGDARRAGRLPKSWPWHGRPLAWLEQLSAVRAQRATQQACSPRDRHQQLPL